MGLLIWFSEAVNDFMSAGPSLLWFFPALLVVGPFVVLAHELGHMFAAQVILEEDVEIHIGSRGKLLEIEAPRTNIKIHALGAGGQALINGAVKPRDQLFIVLAGPVASLAALIPTIWLYGQATEGTLMHGLLWAATFSGIFGVLQIVPVTLSAKKDEAPMRSDGMLALDAIKAMRSNRVLDRLMRER